MRPRDVVKQWVETFNRGDANALAGFYHEDAVNHQVTQHAVKGREAIRAMFTREFAASKMACLIENIFEDGD